jgi:hypothetical protein
MSLGDDFGAEPFKEGNVNSVGFPLSPGQEAWRRRAAEVASTVLAPQAAYVDAGTFPADGLRALWERLSRGS